MRAGLRDVQDVRDEYFWDVFISPGEREAVRERFRQRPDDRCHLENTFVNRRPQQRVIAWSTAPLLDEAGNVRNVICGGAT